ncbi:hypothetical protein EDB87DRAFT_1339166 [Lactarius vividus]|nr:hypothetical protein EDB87DRAFT_1339166 [Lactarius vividus]
MHSVLTLRTPLGLPARRYCRCRFMAVGSLSKIEQRPRVTARAQAEQMKHASTSRPTDCTLLLTYQRLNEAPDTLLRTTFEGIPHTNRTDTETLRASFGGPPGRRTHSRRQHDRRCAPSSPLIQRRPTAMHHPSAREVHTVGHELLDKVAALPAGDEVVWRVVGR